ncbi:cyclin-dependent kinase 11B-like [Mytilus galloprovincialis]|uniref:cyclin-dependent kinase 11B-like n=1 Tax=Mytilus galloprovincialis TaxID=29158 RepID=UPI003F7B5155
MTDASGSSPYEQGELESTPEGGQAMEEDEDSVSELSLSVHSKEALDEEENDHHDHEEQKKEDSGREDLGGEDSDALDIKPPQTHAGRKEKSHKHKRKDDHRKNKNKHDPDRDRDRRRVKEKERSTISLKSTAERPQYARDKHVVSKRDSYQDKIKERERRFRDKQTLQSEEEKRLRSIKERERLELKERERERDKRLREDRERKEMERRKKREEEKYREAQARLEAYRSDKDRNERKSDKLSSQHRSRSRDPNRRDDRGREERSRHKHKSPQLSQQKERRQPEKREVQEEESPKKETDLSSKPEKKETTEEEVEEEEEGEGGTEEESEEETDSDSESDSESESDSDSESESEASKQSEKEEEEEVPHLEKVKSKFDDHSDVESETHSVHMSDQEDDQYYLEATPPDSPVELLPDLPPYFPAIQGCRNVEEFQCLNRIEEGAYGVVYRAKDKKTDDIVALKRLKMEKEKEGFPITSLREINTLLKAQHVNIVTVREIVVGSNMDKIYIVMDYVEHDLKSLMETMKQPFLVGEVKTLLKQLLLGVAHLHDNWIIHRDLKTSNLLLSHKGVLKIGDFGLAREYGEPLKHYTPVVVTLWYRAPELLLGIKEYSTPIDMWSVGCIFAEFLMMKALWSGKSDIDQLNRIFKDLGTPSEKIWPGYNELPAIKKLSFGSFADHPYNTLRQKFGSYLSDAGFNLLNRFLTYSPTKRITAEEAMKVEYFKESPDPIDPSMFPTWPAKSEQPRKHQNSPKPPSGGKAYNKLLGDDDDNIGFHLTNASSGVSAVGPGFALKF